MRIRFKEREDLDGAMPEILRETKPCLRFISEEELNLPIYIPATRYLDDETMTLPLGTMDVKLVPLNYKPMISTGDWVPVLQFKVVISNMKFKDEKFKEVFHLFLPMTSKLQYTHFLTPIDRKIRDYFRYCNMREISYNLNEIEWKD
jgi:hypothetical protein